MRTTPIINLRPANGISFPELLGFLFAGLANNQPLRSKTWN